MNRHQYGLSETICRRQCLKNRVVAHAKGVAYDAQIFEVVATTDTRVKDLASDGPINQFS